MADVHSKKVRSYNMSQIRAKNTKPEVLVRKFLHANGFRFRLHVKNLPGKPDIVLLKYRTIIFVQGCFWHGHEGCRYFVVPKTRTEWWKAKIDYNSLNDFKNINALEEQLWNVIVIWECDLKKGKREKTLSALQSKLSKQLTYVNKYH
jgi:DNA mismatch endonuclease (patch repair protein)